MLKLIITYRQIVTKIHTKYVFHRPLISALRTICDYIYLFIQDGWPDIASLIIYPGHKTLTDLLSIRIMSTDMNIFHYSFIENTIFIFAAFSMIVKNVILK